MTIYNDCDQLDYCEQGVSPEGRCWSFDSRSRFGTDPIALLSTWEHQTLDQLLKVFRYVLISQSVATIGLSRRNFPKNFLNK
ncbi:DUF7693 family protein [Pseudomonas viridiflava]|uniref:DUF7693 family protein n=1 Tax=Pseudomonas viridiflava TaxID=33069 RepID=UPI003B98334A